MRIIEEQKLNLDDVLLVPQRNTLESRSQVELEREFKFYHSPRVWKGIPLFAANLACLAGFELADALRKHKICTALHKFHKVDELKKYFDSYEYRNKVDYVWLSIGMDESEIEKVKEVEFICGQPLNLVIDVPNAHLEKFVKFCAKIRNEFPTSIIMGGNCVTPEMTQELIIHGGLDIVKIQIGTGRLCTTRHVTGVGYGSLSCTIECASAAHGLKSGDKRLGLVCSDGGLYTAGDCAKMYAGGSDFLMSGNLFYGVEECCGEWEYNSNNEKNRLKIYGMSSKEAQEKHYGEYKKYRASEGRSQQYANYKGLAKDVVQEILGGLRSTATYIGASSLKDFNKCAVFAKVNQIHPNMEI